MLTADRLLTTFICLTLSTATAASAQTLNISRPSLAPDGMSVTITVGGDIRPSPLAISEVGKWVVVVTTAESQGTAVRQVRVAEVVPEPDLYEVTGLVRLRLAENAGTGVQAVDVVSLFGKPARVTWSPRKPQGGPGFHAVDKRDKADVFLFGSWVTGVDLAPVYNVDVSVAAPVRDLSIGQQPWRLSVGGAVKSADRRDVDPDSYTVTGKLSRVFPIPLRESGTYVDIQWELVRFEFSRKEESSNFVTAPSLVFSHRLLTRLTESHMVRAALNADLMLGVELGHNMQSKAVPEGYGGIARVVPGLAVYAAFPGGLGLEEVRWTTTYRARLLLTNEPFTDVRDDDEPVAAIDKGTRHEWKDELSLKVTPLFSLTFTHDYGSVPPAFKILNHRYTLGATVMWAWKK